MIARIDLAKFVQHAYTAKADIQVQDVRACLYGPIDGQVVVAIPGTTADPRTWIRDIKAWPHVPRFHSDLGICPWGFLNGALLIEKRLKSVLKGEVPIFVGHSLGGAIAEDLAGLFVAEGLPVARLTVFGCPFAGSFKLRRMVTRAVPIIEEVRNGNDPVPEVPFLPLPWPNIYKHLTPGIAIGKPMLDPINCHFIAAYIASETIAGAK